MRLLWKALALALLRLACSLSGLLRAVRRRLAVFTVAIPITIAMTVPVLETPMIAPEGPVMPAAALLPVPRLVAVPIAAAAGGAAAADAAGEAAESRRRAPLPLRHRRIRRRRHRTRARACAGHCHWPCRRLGQLLAIRHDDARVMFGVLQIVLCKHRVAGRLRIPGERKILLRDMRRRAPDLHIRSVGFEAARQRIVVFPIVITTATAAILLSLPHCPSGSYVTSTSLINAHPANASMVLLASALGLADP